MTLTNELENILQTEADLAEALADVMEKQQQSIIRFDAKSVEMLTQHQEELLFPLRQLETERLRVAARLAKGVPGGPGETLRALMVGMSEEDAGRVSGYGERLKSAVERIMSMNQQNGMLLRHSVRYVREILRLVTDDYRKQLVDQRM